MRKLLVLMLVLLPLWMNAVVEETASFTAFIYGHASSCAYDNYISHIAEGIASVDYNLYAPYDVQTNGFGTYLRPSTAQLTNWAAACNLFLAGDLEGCQTALDGYGYPYDVVIFHDTDTGRTYHMLRERLNLSYYDNNGTPNLPDDDETGSFAYGWGLYVYNTNSTYPVVVTVPHCCDDFPTPAVSVKAFEDWNARYIMFTGAGREVLWTNSGAYYNSKSLSDPTRNSDHPFSRFNNLACAETRTATGYRELAAQIHSYDWNRHEGYANCQISAGYNRTHPDLPIRDCSGDGHDIIHQTNPIVHQANEVGIHPQITMDNFYAVYYDDGDFFYHQDGQDHQVSNSIDLWGYNENTQFQYSISGWSDYDVFDPFFHIEMDELPNEYTQNEANYWWFYGYNQATQTWDYDHLFDHVVAYYSPWVDAMTQTLPYMFGTDPNLPTNPSNLQVTGTDLNSVGLSWDRATDYDFNTYQVLYSTQPIANGGYSTYSRSQKGTLAAQNINSVIVDGLQSNTQYYFAVQAKDYQNNLSNLSNEVTTVTGCAELTLVKALGRDESVDISFKATSQNSNNGFFIQRADSLGGEFHTITSYNDNTALAAQNGVANVNYAYTDTGLVNGHTYYYRIGADAANGTTMLHTSVLPVSPEDIWTITVSNADATLNDTVYFGQNPNSSDAYDADYDVASTDEDYTLPQYLYIQFYESTWDTNYYPNQLVREIRAGYNPADTAKSWVIRVRGNVNGTYTINFEDLLTDVRNTEKLYLVNGSTYVDIFANPQYTFTITNTNWKTFTLWWGNLTPGFYVNNAEYRIYHPGENVSLSWGWNTNHVYSYWPIVNHYNLELSNSLGQSFTVAENLANNVNSYNWTIPAMFPLYYNDLKLKVHAVMGDGDELVEESPYAIGIFPDQVDYTVRPGWSLMNQPFQDNTHTMAELYGGDATFWALAEDQYLETVPDYQTSFWLYSTAAEQPYTWTGLTTQRNNWNTPLATGWNLVPNPHLYDYRIDQLRFVSGGRTLDYNEALQSGLIEAGVFVLQDNNYVNSSMIPQYNSFYIYCLQACSIQFTPFYLNPVNTTFTNKWNLTLTATQQGTASDQIVVGCSDFATQEYDHLYDLRKPPAKPQTPNLEMAVSTMWEGYEGTLWQQVMGRDMAVLGNADTLSWQVVVRSDSLAPITLKLGNYSQIPDSWQVRLIHNLDNYTISDVDSITIVPTQPSTVLTMYITNYWTGATDQPTARKLSVMNYPNPFNPTTTIRLNLPRQQKTQVSIYNIRGQKVRTLCNEVLAAGQHELVWNGRSDTGHQIGTGVYFCRVKTQDKTVTRKMMMLK